MSETQWVIEFRNGRYYQGADADESGPKATAERFATREAADRVILYSAWVGFAGGMAVEVSDGHSDR